mmetsp:Transcript_17568/g.50108  ORF Transcript_17568/g.50108 Transcript_17568/m.50108 type:complete len:200 (-) Transcript_17568:665-1264(-)
MANGSQLKNARPLPRLRPGAVLIRMRLLTMTMPVAALFYGSFHINTGFRLQEVEAILKLKRGVLGKDCVGPWRVHVDLEVAHPSTLVEHEPVGGVRGLDLIPSVNICHGPIPESLRARFRVMQPFATCSAGGDKDHLHPGVCVLALGTTRCRPDVVGRLRKVKNTCPLPKLIAQTQPETALQAGRHTGAAQANRHVCRS